MALPSSPNDRKEVYLSNIAGQGTALPSEPHDRYEAYLDYIAKNGGGGGTGEGDMTKAVYDDDLVVASAGGIKSYVTGAISGKVDKVQGKGLSTNDYDNSAKAIVDGVTAELGNKADKVSSATNGDLASLDSNGNLTDSGKKASDFYNSSETLETDLDGQDKFPFYDFSASAKRQVTFGSIKAKLKEYFDLFYTNVVSSATNGNFAGLDANGNLTDSGKKASDFATASSVTAILDGTTIDSFSDVESALADKVDAVAGKGLSTNDYDDTEKAKVATAFPRSEQAVLGAKNIVPYPYHSPDSHTSHDVGFTVNTNKTVTTDSGTASGDDAVFTLLQKSDAAFNDFFELTKGKTIKLTGVPEGASTSTYWLMIYDTSAHNLVSGEMEYQMPETMPSAFYLQIVVKNGQSASNKIWKPMISFDGGEYAPPAMTNQQLTNKTAELYRYGSLNTNNFRIRLVTADIAFVDGTGTYDLSSLANDFYSFAFAAFQTYGTVWITSAIVNNKVLTVKARNDSGPFTSDGNASIYAFVCEKL